MSNLATAIVEVLRSVLDSAGAEVPLHAPSFSGRELDLVADCVKSGWVSSVGSYVDRFESDLAAFVGAKHAVALVNGTCALHLALRLIGVRAGDEVLIPALTFVATANAVAQLGAIPHFIDVDEKTLGLDPKKLRSRLAALGESRDDSFFNRETGRRITAIVPMHCFGHPAKIAEIVQAASEFGVTVVEDAAEALGSYAGRQHAGTFGKAGVLSFNGNKIITTGGGGAIVTNDSELAKRAKYLSTTAKRPHPWEFYHDEVGYNFRMPNLNAALGCAQLERIDELLAAKRKLASAYAEEFKSLGGVEFVYEPPGARSNYWLCAIRLTNPDAPVSEVLQATNKAGFKTRPVWRLLSDLPMYSGCPQDDLTVSRCLEKSIINLPSSPWSVTRS